jgi:hypothetical protein
MEKRIGHAFGSRRLLKAAGLWQIWAAVSISMGSDNWISVLWWFDSPQAW